MSAVKNMVGQRFGRLIVIERCGSTPTGIATWKCKCDCGSICVIEGAKMRTGNTKSCGCLNRDSSRDRRTTHGKSQTRLYAIWEAMKQRCFDMSNKNYSRYGGRGITVCEEWRNDFQAFYDWAMASGYDQGAKRNECTIDRIDNDKGYSPDNCRWVDMITQRNNRFDSRKVTKNERN